MNGDDIMNFDTFKKAVIEACARMGIAEYELYYQCAESVSIGVFQHEINQFTCSTEGGVCFRCIHGGKMGYASTEALNPAEAAALVERAVDNANCLEAEEAVFLAPGGQVYQPLEDRSYPLPGTDEIIAAVLETQQKLYQADPAVIDGSQTEGVAERSQIAICNSKGLDLHSTTTLTGLVTVAVVTDGKEMANDFQIRLGKLSDIDTDALTQATAQEAKRKLGGQAAPTGQYPVVFNPKAMSDLLQTYSGIFSSEAAQKGLSKLAGKEGSVIAAPAVTLTDDPFHPVNPGARNFDAEGSPTCRKNIIEKGVLTTLLYNLKTAAVAGKQTTGNASKAGYAADVGISPFTLYLAPGQISEEALLEQAGQGVYITSLGGLHAGADPISGDFSLQSSGFMIRQGKKAEYVKAFTVAGNFYELLQSIECVANNLELPGLARFGSPSVLVQGLSVAGK